MTLILTVANSQGVYQSSDYQLTDLITRKPISDVAGSKQLSAIFNDLEIILAFTGVATRPNAERTIDHLLAVLRTLSPNSDIDGICQALKTNCEMRYGSRDEVTLVLSIASFGKPFKVAEITNVVWTRKRKYVNSCFRVNVWTIRKHFHLISGWRPCVLPREEGLLEALSRDTDASRKEIMSRLAEINSISAGYSDGMVSKGCWATAQYADGEDRRSESFNFGENPGFISDVFPPIDVSQFIQKNFRPVPGKEIGIRQRAGFVFRIGPTDSGD